MSLNGAAGLYRLNICVDKLVLVNQCNQKRKQVCLQAIFWDLPQINIYQTDPTNEHEDPAEHNVFKNFEVGSSGYFHSETVELIRYIQRHPILFKIVENIETPETLQIIGTCAVKVTEKFSECISRAATFAKNSGVLGTVKGSYSVWDKNNILVGTLSLQLRLICYDISRLTAPKTLCAKQSTFEKLKCLKDNSAGYLVIPNDLGESTSEGVLHSCQILNKKKLAELLRKRVSMVPKGAATVFSVDISGLECDRSSSENSMITIDDGLCLGRKTPSIQTERKLDFGRVGDGITCLTVEQPPGKDEEKAESSGVDEVDEVKVILVDYTSDVTLPFDSMQFPGIEKTSPKGSRLTMASQFQNSKLIKINGGSFKGIRRSSAAACPCQEPTKISRSRGNDIARTMPSTQAKQSHTEYFISRAESNLDPSSVHHKRFQTKENQVNKTSHPSELSKQNKEISLGHVKLIDGSSTSSQPVTFSEEIIVTHGNSGINKISKLNLEKRTDSNDSSKTLFLEHYLRGGPLEVHYSQDDSYTDGGVSGLCYQNEQTSDKKCIPDETTHLSRHLQRVECVGNAPPMSQYDCLSNKSFDEATEKHSPEVCPPLRVSTRPSHHCHDTRAAEASEDVNLNFQNINARMTASNISIQLSQNVSDQGQTVEGNRSFYVNVDDTISSSRSQLSSMFGSDEQTAKLQSSQHCYMNPNPIQNKENEAVKCTAHEITSNNHEECATAHQNFSHRENKVPKVESCAQSLCSESEDKSQKRFAQSPTQFVNVVQHNPEIISYMGSSSNCNDSEETRRLKQDYTAPIPHIHQEHFFGTKSVEGCDVTPNSVDGTSQCQSKPENFLQCQQEFTEYGNSNGNSALSQKLEKGYCALEVGDINSGLPCQEKTVDGLRAVARHDQHVSFSSTATLEDSRNRAEHLRDDDAEEQRLMQCRYCNAFHEAYKESQKPKGDPTCLDYRDNTSTLEKQSLGEKSFSTDWGFQRKEEQLVPNLDKNRLEEERFYLEQAHFGKTDVSEQCGASKIQPFMRLHETISEDSEMWSEVVDSLQVLPAGGFNICCLSHNHLDTESSVSTDSTAQTNDIRSKQGRLSSEMLEKATADSRTSSNGFSVDATDNTISRLTQQENVGPYGWTIDSEIMASLSKITLNPSVTSSPNSGSGEWVSGEISIEIKAKSQKVPVSASCVRSPAVFCKAPTRMKEDTIFERECSNNDAGVDKFLTQACPRANNHYNTCFARMQESQSEEQSLHNWHCHHYDFRETGRPLGSWNPMFSKTNGTNSCVCTTSK